MDERPVWRRGRVELRAELEPLVRALVRYAPHPDLEILREKAGRRRLARGRLASGTACFFKHYPAGDRRRPLREAAKRLLDLTPAAREFRALRRLHAAGVGVPEPLAYYRLEGGGRLLVTRALEGEPLRRAIGRPAPERRALLHAVGRLVARLHAAGYVHRDLHRGNVWVTREGPVLLDCPAVLPLPLRHFRRQDVGKLDASLAGSLSLVDRVRLRAASIGAQPPLSPAARREIRALGRAADERRRTHLRSRTRRCLRTGRLYAHLRTPSGAGMRLRAADETQLRRALEAEGGEAGDLRVLRFEGGGTWGLGASPARRVWIAGQGLRARGIGAPAVLAFVELRRWGRVEGSAAVVESVRPADPAALGGPGAWLREVVDLASALRRDRVAHGRLEHAGLCLAERGLGLLDLEAVRFPRRLSARAAQRIDAFVARHAARSGGGDAAQAAALARYRSRVAFLPGETAGVRPPRS